MDTIAVKRDRVIAPGHRTVRPLARAGCAARVVPALPVRWRRARRRRRRRRWALHARLRHRRRDNQQRRQRGGAQPKALHLRRLGGARSGGRSGVSRTCDAAARNVDAREQRGTDETDRTQAARRAPCAPHCTQPKAQPDGPTPASCSASRRQTSARPPANPPGAAATTAEPRQVRGRRSAARTVVSCPSAPHTARCARALGSAASLLQPRRPQARARPRRQSQTIHRGPQPRRAPRAAMRVATHTHRSCAAARGRVRRAAVRSCCGGVDGGAWWWRLGFFFVNTPWAPFNFNGDPFTVTG